jgi:hypothetical protein
MTTRLNGIIFFLATITGIAVRTVMTIFTIDGTSGFIKQEYWAVAIICVLFLLAAAAVIFLTSLSVKIKPQSTPSITGKFFGFSCVFMAGAMVYETFFSPLLNSASSYQIALHRILTLAAAAALVYIAFNKITGKEFNKLFCAVPISFWAMRLIIIFTEFSTISTFSDTLIETAVMCLCLITFVFYGKVECNLKVKSYRLFFATSLLAAYVCAISSFPRVITQVLKFEQAIHMSIIPCTTAIFAGLFLVVFAYKLLNEIKE